MAQFKLKNGQILTFRQACGDDAAACLDFLRCVGSETDYLLIGPEGLPGVTVEQEAELLNAAHDSFWRRFYVGYVGEEIACIANVEINAHPRTKHNATMGISVRKKYWRQGIGSVCVLLIIIGLVSRMQNAARSAKAPDHLELDGYRDYTHAVSAKKRRMMP